MPSEPPRGFRIVVALTSAGGPSNPRFAQIRSSTLHKADVEFDVLFAPYGDVALIAVCPSIRDLLFCGSQRALLPIVVLGNVRR